MWISKKCFRCYSPCSASLPPQPIPPQSSFSTNERSTLPAAQAKTWAAPFPSFFLSHLPFSPSEHVSSSSTHVHSLTTWQTPVSHLGQAPTFSLLDQSRTLPPRPPAFTPSPAAYSQLPVRVTCWTHKSFVCSKFSNGSRVTKSKWGYLPWPSSA